MTTKKTTDLSLNLAELKKITDWFEAQQEIDIEVGLEKVREAASLIKASKARLAEVENEFEEIKKEITDENNEFEIEDGGNKSDNPNILSPKIEEELNPEDIPF